ncbi:LPS biosynthesis glycosyltransferase [Paludisphaera soli]|uniref:LPS biosynthesis glycosyltransferase n=1 Tax=Paludisphaera soli TaxID=2712865 RepID=UPI0013E9AA24|nr:LPS biosynthesis glycosyltransferase [Paludisphaera soli]
MGILDYFSRGYVINLPSRTDRRRETEAMFRRVGLVDWREHIEFHAATRPRSAEGYASLGARGGLLSHTAVLRKALDQGARNVLVMEDDLEISPEFVAKGEAIAEALDREEWGFAYFGHCLDDLGEPIPGRPLQRYDGPILLAHFLAVNGTVLPRLVEFMESVDKRPAGHPDGGPMFADGALTFFRMRNPDVLTLAANPNLGLQRSSKSDITTRWFDEIPGVGAVARPLRRVKRWLKR